MNLYGKRVLLISPSFFSYPYSIKQELEDKGAVVEFIDERPCNNFITKASLRLGFTVLIRKRLKKHYRSIIDKLDEFVPDVIFIVNPEAIGYALVKAMRAKKPKAKIFVYLWDSIDNKKQALSVAEEADVAFTFDNADAERFQCLNFLPLFFVREYYFISKKKFDEKYGASFIGTLHSDRYCLSKKILDAVEKKGFSTFRFYYCPSKVLFFYKKYVTREFSSIKYSEVSFSPLSQHQLVDVISQSLSVLDIHHSQQNGLTMRTFEVLGAGKKLITTNCNIIKYPFYSDSNIHVINRNNPSVEGFELGYQKFESGEMNVYSLSSWLDKIFSKGLDS